MRRELRALFDATNGHFPPYKHFVIREYYEDFPSDFIIFCAKRDAYNEIQRDERGALTNVIRHNEEKIVFKIEEREFSIENKSEIDVIIDRLKAEVDYYLNHKKPNLLADFDIQECHGAAGMRKYRCPCCGTEYTTNQPGYTPKCENCGARMAEIQET